MSKKIYKVKQGNNSYYILEKSKRKKIKLVWFNYLIIGKKKAKSLAEIMCAKLNKRVQEL